MTYKHLPPPLLQGLYSDAALRMVSSQDSFLKDFRTHSINCPSCSYSLVHDQISLTIGCEEGKTLLNQEVQK